MLVDPPYGMFADLQPKLARYLPTPLATTACLVVETEARTEPDLPLLPLRTKPHATAPHG